jgi:Flp pilus assembly protein protease CpaA
VCRAEFVTSSKISRRAQAAAALFLLGNAIFISLSQIASREVVNKVKERFYVVFVVIAYQIPS